MAGTISTTLPELLRISGVTYALRSRKSPSTLKIDAEDSLATVIHFRSTDWVDDAFVEERVARFATDDDVFHQPFVETVVLFGPVDKRASICSPAVTKACASSVVALDPRQFPSLPEGPYALRCGDLLEAWRVYEDTQVAFTASVWPSRENVNEFELLPIAGSNSPSRGVAVPSRLYFPTSKSKPINGMRIAIKDAIHLAGVRTSLCNRAYNEFYDPAPTTAKAVQTLIDLGAQIVGKTHLSSFALREEPTECIDYPAPFNPRGDGYISPAGSSSGSGAAIASYDWLDLTMGTDTTGSGRRPALWNGCFGFRPSQNAVSSEGVVATMPIFDTPSLFCRDIFSLQDVIRVWYERELGPTTVSSSKPISVVWLDEFMPVSNAAQMRVLRNFVDQLCEHVSTKLEMTSFKNLWSMTSPVSEKNIEVYLENVVEHGFHYKAYECFSKFRSDYQEKHKRTPYISEPVQWLWGIGRILSEQQYQGALQKFEVFRKWFEEHVLKVHSRNTIIILPVEKLEPRYRDIFPARPLTPPKGLNLLFLSPTLGAPEVVVPIGHIPYHSKVTSQIEHLPVAVALLSPHNSEMWLLDILKKFLKISKRPTAVRTGSIMFDLSEHPTDIPSAEFLE